MKMLSLVVICVLAYGLSACSSLSVSYDYNQQVDFSQFKTYDWMPFPEKKDANKLNRLRFINAVENNLKRKGLDRSTQKPDLLIATHFVKQRKVDITNWGYTYAPNVYYSRYSRSHSVYYGHPVVVVPGYNVSVYEYEQGTLILDFIDSNSNELVWRATATAIISPASTPEKQTEKINKAVEKILEHFPPHAH